MVRRCTARTKRRVSSVVSLLSLVSVTACQRPSVEETATTAVVPVVVEPAKVGLLRGVIAVAGVVAAAPGAEMLVVAPAAARIAQLPHAEGDRVKKGDVLVRFDIPTLASDVTASRAKVMQAAARVEAARANVKRLSSLLEQGVAAPRDVEDATTAARRGRGRARAGAERRPGSGRAVRPGRCPCALFRRGGTTLSQSRRSRRGRRQRPGVRK